MGARLRRRELIGATGAGLAGAGLAGVLLREGSGASGPEAPRNVVLVVIDTLRPDHLGCYGNARVRTPSVDALAGESLRFTRVFPEAMPTVPARRSILTGRRAYPFRGWEPWRGLAKRPGWSPIMSGTETLATALRRRGYWTAYVSDNPFLTYTRAFEPFRGSVDRYARVWGQRGSRRPAESVPRAEAVRRLPQALRTDDKIANLRQYLADNGRARRESEQSAARVFAAAERMLDRARRERPFLMVVDSFDPHELWAPPRRYLDMYGDPDYRGPEIATVSYRDSGYLTAAQLERLGATYAACVTMVDRWLGHFLDGLHARGLDEDTVVALVSDHGIYLGEHGRTGKSDSYLHPELIQVPLLLRDPEGHGAGEASDYFATTVDLAPTLMTMAGLRPPAGFEGTDLSPLLDGDDPGEERPFAYGGYSNFSFVRDGRWAFVTRNDNRWRRLYDLSRDPGETRDVSDGHPEVTRRMWRLLVGETGEPPPRYSDAEIEAPPRELGPRRRRRRGGGADPA